MDSDNRDEPIVDTTTGLTEPAPRLSDDEIGRRLVRLLRLEGPDCLSVLAMKLVISNKDVKRVMDRLQDADLVTIRPDWRPSSKHETGEHAWGLKNN